MQLSIAGHDYRVKFDLENDDEDFANLDADGRVIHLRKGLSKSKNVEEAVQCIAHEIMHAAIHESGLDNLLAEALEEAIVRALDNLAYPAIRDLILAQLSE